MQIREILDLERENKDKIYLLKEGIFYRAYNRSAMRLCQQIMAYKVSIKYIKKVKESIYYCGFPQQVLDKILYVVHQKGYDLQHEENRVVVSGIADSDDYEQWKKQYKLEKEEKTIRVCEPIAKYTTMAEMLMQKIREYPLENSTPMQTMLFVQELKKDIQNGSGI